MWGRLSHFRLGPPTDNGSLTSKQSSFTSALGNHKIFTADFCDILSTRNMSRGNYIRSFCVDRGGLKDGPPSLPLQRAMARDTATPSWPFSTQFLAPAWLPLLLSVILPHGSQWFNLTTENRGSKVVFGGISGVVPPSVGNSTHEIRAFWYNLAGWSFFVVQFIRAYNCVATVWGIIHTDGDLIFSSVSRKFHETNRLTRQDKTR